MYKRLLNGAMDKKFDKHYVQWIRRIRPRLANLLARGEVVLDGTCYRLPVKATA